MRICYYTDIGGPIFSSTTKSYEGCGGEGACQNISLLQKYLSLGSVYYFKDENDHEKNQLFWYKLELF